MKKKFFQAIIETPRGSRSKYKYDAFLNMFKLDKVLPAGFSFPFDFGFVPNTIAEDGDPLDIMVLTDEPTFTGCLIGCRILGAIVAQQTDESAKNRNDRIIAIPELGEAYNRIHHLKELDRKLVKEIEHFFISYHSYNGVKFEPVKIAGPDYAIKLIEQAINENT